MTDIGKRIAAKRLVLMGYANKIGVRPQDCEEAAQHAIYKAWRNRQQLRQGASDEELGRWMCIILRNLVFSQWRHRKFVEQVSNVVAADEACDPDWPRLFAQLEAEAKIDSLSPSFRAVVTRLIDGQSYQEIAAALGIPVGTVKSRIARAREALTSEA